MDISYREWSKNVRTIVAAFADLEFQKAAWRGELPTSFGSPGEMMCALFDDSDVSGFLHEHAEALGATCVAAGNALIAKLETYVWPMEGQFIDALELLRQDRWREICASAAQFLSEMESNENGARAQFPDP